MKRLVVYIIFALFFFTLPQITSAQGYNITSFHSDLTINKDTTLTVKEKIIANFSGPNKHGIIRFIPLLYKSQSSQTSIFIQVTDVTDMDGKPINFVTRLDNGALSIKIGDAQKVIKGPQSYVITYRVYDAVRVYNDVPEVYWNIAGDQWDVPVSQVSASITSEYAPITGVACFTGVTGSTHSDCSASYENESALITTLVSLQTGEDMTLVVTFDKNNSLQFPSFYTNVFNKFSSEIAIFILFSVPTIIMAGMWYKRGRDITFGNNLYYGNQKDTRPEPLFERKHIPTVYTPINTLTPGQAGVLIDQWVHPKDIVAEIAELARLGFITIEYIKKQGIFGKNDYMITNNHKDTSNLLDFQIYILESIFPMGSGASIKASELKKAFPKHVPHIKQKIYQSLTKGKTQYFVQNPEKTRLIWCVILSFIFVPFFIISVAIFTPLYDFVLPISAIFWGFISAFFAFQMPARSAQGYATYRDLLGLKNFIKLGKWRYEVYEKKLFLEEIVPLAISLGVVKELSSHMKELGISPSQIKSLSFGTNYTSFEKSFSKAAFGTSSNSWSGGSGSSGSSGGGFGGGGGGSW